MYSIIVCLHAQIERTSLALHRLVFLIFLRPFLGHCSSNSFILPPWKISSPHLIRIHGNVKIDKYSWIKVQSSDLLVPSINICSGASIGRFVHIICSNSIHIGSNVMINERVYISDATHDIANPSLAPLNSSVLSTGKIFIDEGAWVGEGSYIYGNVRVGRRAVIGANSVVKTDIPDFEVWAGSPARKLYSIK
jgi:acetyltransferase-like isoleucine patch superfamily enzyme